jgi:hypothetical protein
MKHLRLALLVYSYLFVFVAMAAGVLSADKKDLLLPGVLLFPVVLYFAGALTDRLTKFTHRHPIPHLVGIKNVFKFYSLIISLLVFMAGLIFARGPTEYLFALLLLPLPLHFFTTWWRSKNGRKFKINVMALKLLSLRRINRQKNSDQSSSSQFTEKQTNPLPKNSIPQPTVTVTTAADDNLRPIVVIETLESSPPLSLSIDEIEIELESDEFSNQPGSDLLDEVEGEEVDEAPGLGGIKDLDRRQFLKLLGGGSLGILAMSLFSPQKASAAFFGSVPGPGVVAIKDSSGNQIDPAEKSPTDGYRVSEIDDTSLPSYYGFVDKDGNWYVAKEDSSGSYRYSKGTSSFSTNWTGRAALTYDYFDAIF